MGRVFLALEMEIARLVVALLRVPLRYQFLLHHSQHEQLVLHRNSEVEVCRPSLVDSVVVVESDL